MRATRLVLSSAVLLVAAAPAAHTACSSILFAPSVAQSFGNACVLAGDIDADGFGDWAVASQTTTTGAGRVYVYRGGAPRNVTPDFTLVGVAPGDRFGAAVASIGDWNRDGFRDLAVGAPFDDLAGTDAGRVYIYFGGPAFDAVADVILNGPVPGGRFGTALGGGADLNQDGGADLVVGAPRASPSGLEGKVFVYFGAAPPPTIPSLTANGAFGEQLGAAVALGDLNGDGVADLAAGAPGSGAGARTKLFWGGAGFDALADRVLIAGGVGTGFGEALAVGDVNGDAQPDLVAGAPTFGGTGGTAYVFYGGPSSDEFADLFLGGLTTNFGRFVAAGSDLSGDGLGDFVVGVSGREVRIYEGGPAVDDVPEQIWTAEVPLDGFASAGAVGPDTDGNGTAELLVGAPLQGGVGRAYLERPDRIRITAPAQLTVAAGATVNLHLCVHNDEFTALVYNVHIADDQGWVSPFDASPTIASGDSACFDLPVTASGASCAAGSTVTISLIPPGCASPALTKQVTVLRTVAPPVITTCALLDTLPEPGEQAQLQFCFQNVTQATRNYVYETSGWANGCPTGSSTVTLVPGGVFCMTRVCPLPVGAQCGDVLTMIARVRDQCAAPSAWVQVSKTLSVTAVSAVTVACAVDTTVDAGQSVHRLLHFTNSSTTSLTYNYSAGDAFGWGAPQSGSVNLGVGQTHTVDYALTTPALVCVAQDDAVTLHVTSTACPAREFQCTSHVVVPFHAAVLQCPADTTVGDNVTVQRRARWTNEGLFARTYEYSLNDTRGWGAPVTGTQTVAPGQTASAVITLQVPPLCFTQIDSVRFQVAITGCPLSQIACVSRVLPAMVTAGVTCPADFLAPSGVARPTTFQLLNTSLSAQTFAYTIQDSRGWGTPVAQNITVPSGQIAFVGFSLTAPTLPVGQFQISTIMFVAEDATCHQVFSCTARATAGTISPPEFFIEAAAFETKFGEPLATTADLSGDGIADLVAGAQSISPPGVGRLHLEFGGTALGGSPELGIGGEVSGDGFGVALAAGDLNRDGYGDFVVAAPLADMGALDGGRLYAYLGGPNLDVFADRVFTGSSPGGHMGEGLAGVGDVNADGYDDLLIGIPGAFNGLGFLYFGGPAFDTNPDRFLVAQSPGERFGTRAARGGDLNGDGYQDFLVGAPDNDVGGTDFGAVYVYFGGPSVDGSPDLVLNGDGGRFGDAITAADFDGDGWSDVIVGAPGRGIGGRVSVFRGGPGVLNVTADWVYDSPSAGEQLGASLSAGDLDGDGDADLAVGTLNPVGGAALRVLIFAGGSNADDLPAAVLLGTPGTRFGAAVAADRDVTGDGHRDVLVGASTYPPDGRVFVYTVVTLVPTDVPDMPPAPAAVLHTFLGEPWQDGTVVRIEYALERGARDLRLEIFDVAGRRIRSLEQGTRGAGLYAVSWDRRDATGALVRRGVYLVRLRADEFVATRKAVVVRP